MRRAASGPVIIGIVLLLALGAGSALGQTKEVSGTKHDVVAPGDSPCASCHLPRDAGGELLWARDPNTSGPLSGLKSICFSCHDGTITSVGAYAFDPSRLMHPRDAGVKDQDCDRCHDPHGTSYERFLKVPGGANFCQDCHSRAGPGNHPTNVDSMSAGDAPADGHWDPSHGDFSGTRLWNPEGTGPGTVVKCLTCHAAHGGVPGTQFNTMAFKQSSEELGPLCLNCHFGRGGS